MTLFLSCAWGALYILCAGLGFLVSPSGPLKFAVILLSVLCFVPGALLLWEGCRTKNRKIILSVRWVCIVSLALTTLFLVAFFLCAAFASETVVNGVFIALAIVSAPMFSGQYWVISLALWGGLLSATFLKKLPR
ncbi:MAG: hypothetical protein IKU57_04865 [Oscillospiraceae bacterium]|nr:hypothetical protein [Oscillospiraceae bacterium]